MMVRMAAKVIEVSCYHNATSLFWKMSKVRRNYRLGLKGWNCLLRPSCASGFPPRYPSYDRCHARPRCRGSSTRLSRSPTRFTAITVRNSASPGKIIVHGA